MFRPKPNPASNLVKLKNGAEVPVQAMISTKMALEKIQDNPIAIHELLEKCKNPNYKMSRYTKELVERYALMSSDKIHEYTRNVILSAVESNGPLCFTISSPVAQSRVSNKL